MKTQNYTLHIISLCALVTLGNAIIVMKSADLVNTIIFLGLSMMIMCGVNLLLDIGRKIKAIYLSLSFLLFVFAIYGAATTFLDYTNFLKTEQMPQTGVTLLAIMFLVVVLYFGAMKISILYKYSLLVFVAAIIIIALCFLGGAKNFDYNNLSEKNISISFSLKEYLKYFSSIVVLPLLKQKGNKTAVFWGVAVGFFLILVANMQVVFTLGTRQDVLYPYIKSVGVISSGSLFTRLDGLVYFLFFVTALVKTVVDVNAMKMCINIFKTSIFSK